VAIKVVVLDSGRLPGGVDFPPLELDKYGWEQYPGLSGDEVAERCWRADIVVSLGTPIDRAALEKMHKLGLLICVGPACSGIDQAAVRERGVELMGFPDADYASVGAAEDLCMRVSAAIDHYVRNCARQERQP
jgi:lactate dehydrogenase-like 2-hydroxyacid dehydrogenase